MIELLRELKNIKEQQGISSDELAARCGVAKSTITRMFAGNDPRLQTFVDVANALGAKLIVSTDVSRQAFSENAVRPYRELLAEKEAHFREYKEESEAWKRKFEAEEKRTRRLLRASFAVAIAIVVALIADILLHII